MTTGTKMQGRYGVVVFATLSVLIGACQAQEVKTSPETTKSKASAATQKKEAGLGDAITLKGNDDGSSMKVTVVKVLDPARGADEFTTAQGRFVGVQIRLQNVGTAVYSDSPSNGAKVIDMSDQQFDSDISDVKNCPSFSGNQATIRPGAARLGCIVFDVPKNAKLASFQFTLDSGFGPQTGEWILR